jgi:hypothetical protein
MEEATGVGEREGEGWREREERREGGNRGGSGGEKRNQFGW